MSLEHLVADRLVSSEAETGASAFRGGAWYIPFGYACANICAHRRHHVRSVCLKCKVRMYVRTACVCATRRHAPTLCGQCVSTFAAGGVKSVSEPANGIAVALDLLVRSTEITASAFCGGERFAKWNK
jgi:hypothetical protein